ncbi:MAG: hypothetical protein J7559_11925 [Cohnella sp.]|nr:hypothetical protein [Cohnella sp.]
MFQQPRRKGGFTAFVLMLTMALALALGLAGCAKEPADKGAVPLSFREVTSEQKIERTAEPNDPSDIVLEAEAAGGSILVYRKQGDLEYLYGQYRTDSARYELGIVSGAFFPLDSGVLSITSLTLNGYSVVRINGAVGANAPLHNYYRLDNGEILPFLLVDTGHAAEIDLDGDGMEEIVASHGLPMQAYVYSFKDGRFKWADVNEALGATHVILNADNRFEVQAEQGSSEHSRYVYRNGSLIEGR